ncbi:hypothetical protein [Streptomyces sp. NPDC001450]
MGGILPPAVTTDGHPLRSAALTDPTRRPNSRRFEPFGFWADFVPWHTNREDAQAPGVRALALGVGAASC